MYIRPGNGTDGLDGFNFLFFDISTDFHWRISPEVETREDGERVTANQSGFGSASALVE